MRSTATTDTVASVPRDQQQPPGAGASLGGFDHRDGLGVQEWDDGCTYEGDFVRGLKHGEGKYQWSSGEVDEVLLSLSCPSPTQMKNSAV